MKLEDLIRASIYRYPGLYRAKDYVDSRLRVLDHLFLVIGNGYEWHRDGYLISGKKEGRKTLPNNYFEMELYEMETDKPKEAMAALKAAGLFCYALERPMRGGQIVILQGNTKEETLRYYQQYATPLFPKRKSFQWTETLLDIGTMRTSYSINPYPICEYSALKEILNGKTNSMRQDNFDLVVQPDWLAGCVDIALEAKKYYNDRNRYKNHTYYTHHHSKDPKVWRKFRKEQLEILDAFLKKYA